MRRAHFLLLLPLLVLSLWLAMRSATVPSLVPVSGPGIDRSEAGTVEAGGPADGFGANGPGEAAGELRQRSVLRCDVEDRIAGRVVDEHGLGVAGAEVWSRLQSDDGQASPAAARPRLRARTDTSGDFVLDGSWHELCLQAFAAGYRPSDEHRLVGVLRPDRPVVLELRRGSPSILGRVFDEEGRALAGARVRMRNVPGTYRQGSTPELDARLPDASTWRRSDGVEHRWRIWRETRTDGRGRFVLDSLPLGSIEVLVEAEDHAFAARSLWLTDDRPTELEFRLEAACWIEGRVTDPAGEPVAGARVQLYSTRQTTKSKVRLGGEEREFTVQRAPLPGFGADECFDPVQDRPEARSDANGRYRLAARPGPWQVEARHPAYGGVEARLQVQRGERSTEWNPVLGAGRVLRLRLIDQRDRSLAGWWVALHGGVRIRTSVPLVSGMVSPGFEYMPALLAARSDAEGRLVLHGVTEGLFELRIGMGPHELVVHALDSTLLEKAWVEGDEQLLRIPAERIPSASLKLRVLGPGGGPLGGVACLLEPIAGPRCLIERRTRLADGSVGFGSLPPGPYSLLVLAPGHPPAQRTGIELRAGEALVLEPIRLEPGLHHVVELEAAEEAWFEGLEVDLVLDRALPARGDVWQKSFRLSPHGTPGEPKTVPPRRRFRCNQPLPPGDFEIHVNGPSIRPLQRRVPLHDTFVPRLVLQAR